MKAAQYNSYGGPEVIKIKEVLEPVLNRGQVLVEVYAASINPVDWKVRAGYMKDMMPLEFPVTIGGNFSGVVRKVADDVAEFKIGDEVYGQALVLNGGSGSIAEMVASNTANTVYKPKRANHIEAASLPLVGVSAIQALEQHINLHRDQKILINGGSGGIGSIAIQLAKHIGAYVVATASTEHIDFVKTLGASEVIDYKKENVAEKIHDFDAVFDTAGGESRDNAMKVLKKGGVIVSMTGAPDQKLAEEYGVKAIGQNTDTNAKNLIRLAELVDQGIIKPQVDKVFTLDQTKEAFEYQETSHPKGKVVISMK